MSDTFKNIKKSTIINRSFHQNEPNSTPESDQPDSTPELAKRLKQHVAADKIEICLEELLANFQAQRKPAALNQTILLSAKLNEIKLQLRYDQIAPEVFGREKVRIREALLALIDGEL